MVRRTSGQPDSVLLGLHIATSTDGRDTERNRSGNGVYGDSQAQSVAHHLFSPQAVKIEDSSFFFYRGSITE